MMNGQIVIDATLQALDGRAEQLAAVLRRTQRACRGEPGCIVYRMTRDLDAVDTFHVFEIWHDEASLQAHAAAAPFRAFRTDVADCGRLVSSTWRVGMLSTYPSRNAAEARA